MFHHPRQWFAPKHIGIGWRPATWEGWVVMAVVVLGVLLFVHRRA